MFFNFFYFKILEMFLSMHFSYLHLIDFYEMQYFSNSFTRTFLKVLLFTHLQRASR